MDGYWNRYWSRIALGALLVFVVGFGARAAVNKGKNEFRTMVATVGARLPLQLAHMGFRVDGRNLGDVTAVDVQRTSSEDIGRISIRVRPSDAAALDGLKNCAISVMDHGRYDAQHGFRCAGADDVAGGDLVQVGDVTFDPGDLTRPLYLPRHEMTRWRHAEIRKLDASLQADPGGTVHARGTYDLLARHGASEQGSFTLKADSQGAVIAVRDGQGRAVLDFRADHDGVDLKVRDRHGRNLVRLIADSVSAALRDGK
jgi:hypothetical protein